MTFLAVDIGNTAVSLGVFRDGRVKEVFTVETSLLRRKISPLYKIFKGIAPQGSFGGDVVICSVVPPVLKTVETAVRKRLRVRPLVVGRDLAVPMKNNYRNPRQVGQDRLVCAYAAKRLYGAPAVVIDFGTAITLDVVSARGEYEGGIIVPGLRLSAESLFQKTALLPRIEFIKPPQSLIGKDTQGSILSGLFYGYAALCGGLIEQLKKKVSGSPKVIVTGGYTDLMKKFLSSKIDHIDRFLVFQGMDLLRQSASKKILTKI